MAAVSVALSPLGCDVLASKVACEGDYDCFSGVCVDGECTSLFAPSPDVDGGIDDDGCLGPGRLGPANAPWNQDVRDWAVDVDSSLYIDHLAAQHVAPSRMQIDFSQPVLRADDDERAPFVPTDSWYEPDCDGGGVALPAGGAVEGSTSYTCPNEGDDCHLVVVHAAECELVEVWRATVDDGVLYGGCQARWDLDDDYAEGRGLQCTSADAAGLPIAPLLAHPDDVDRGVLRHALRITLPPALVQEGRFVEPAMHTTASATGDALTLPLGARLRLKADVVVDDASPARQTLVQALQRYGAVVAGTGTITFTFASDLGAQASWASLDVDPHVLKGLQWGDFEVLALGPRIPFTGDCIRTN